MFATKGVFEACGVSEGEEVFFAGLLTQHFGAQRNYPVVRYGRIALIPEEKINTGEGPTDCYLVECQSFPGNSGSPVFLWLSPTRTPGQIVAGGGGLFLMGVMKGYFPQAHEVLVSEVGAQKLIWQENVGIPAVVPADKIKETLFSTKLVEQRDKALGEFAGSMQIRS